MLRLGKRIVQTTGILGLGTFGFAYYNFSELRGDPKQLYQAT